MKLAWKWFIITMIIILTVSATAMADEGQLVLPSNLTEIKEEAFMGDRSLYKAVIPDGTQVIGANAFSNCTNLREVYIPDSVFSIGTNAFSGCPNVQIFCKSGSTALRYAKGAGLEYYLLDAVPQKPVYDAEDPSASLPVWTFRTNGETGTESVMFPALGSPDETYDGIYCYISADEGQSWQRVENLIDVDLGGSWEAGWKAAMVDNLTPGHYLLTYTRYNVVEGRVYESEPHNPEGFTILHRLQASAVLDEVIDEEEGVPHTAVRLTWSEDELAQYYQVFRVIEGSVEGSLQVFVPGDQHEMLDTSVGDGIRYQYSVCAIASNTYDQTWSNHSCVEIETPQNIRQIQYLAVSGETELDGGGNQLVLTAVYDPVEQSNPQLTWSSSNPEVATVDENGVVTSDAEVADDTDVVITCTANDGSELTAQHTIHVKDNRLFSYGNYNIVNVKLSTAYMNAWPADASVEAYKSLLGCSKNDNSAEQMFALVPVPGYYDRYRIRVMEYDGKYVVASTTKGWMTSYGGSSVFKVVPHGDYVNFLTVDGTLALSLAGLVESSASYRYNVRKETYDASNTAQRWRLVPKSATLTTNVSSISLYVGGSQEITAYITSDGAGNKPPMQYSTSDPTVATVDESGVVTAVGVGKATILARTFSGIGKSIPVTVSILDPSNLPVIQFKNATMTQKENECFTIPLTVTGFTSRFAVQMTVSDASFDIVSTKFTSINQTLVQLGQSGVIYKLKRSTLTTAKPNSKSRRFFATGASMNIYVGGNYNSAIGDRTITLTLNTPSDGSYVVGENSTLTLILKDADADRPSRGTLTKAQYVAKCAKWFETKFPSSYYWNHYIGAVNDDNTITQTACSENTPHKQYGCTLDTWCNGNYKLYQGSVVCNMPVFYDSRQCMGFALKIMKDMFGSSPTDNTSGWTKYTSYSLAKGFQPGDYVRIIEGTNSDGSTYGHSFVVLAVNGDTLSTLECNMYGTCVIFRGSRSASAMGAVGKFDHIYRYTGW